MNLTAQLKSWLVENKLAKEDAGDDEFRKAAGLAIVEGKLTAEKFRELTEDPDEKKVTALEQKLDMIATGLQKLAENQTKESEGKNGEAEKEKAEKEAKEKAEKAEKEAEGKETPKPTAMEKMVSSIGMHEADDKGIDIRVQEAADRYDHNRKVLTYPSETKGGKPHPNAGRPVMDFEDCGRVINQGSDRDKAVCGAYAKFAIATQLAHGSRKTGFQRLPQHDKELLLHAMDNYEWSGSSTGSDRTDIDRRKLTPHEKQSLIDDAVSGGFEAAPIVFDDDVISTPLLNGELYPFVYHIPLDRGRRIEGVATGTPTSAWGGIDNTAIALFNTLAYVTAFDTTIHRWEGAIRIGLDFLSDTPIDFGAHVTQQYGERLLEDLDNVIATGNGATQPLGIINSGVAAVGWGGATNLGNYELLRQSVSKQEHTAAVKASAVFCGTETSYWRARGIPVGGTDLRRIMGYDYDSYSWMGRPYKINNSLTNQQIFYAILRRYRMYVRRGLTVRSSTEGETLIRGNNMLITVTARYGGQIERGACGAMTITAPA